MCWTTKKRKPKSKIFQSQIQILDLDFGLWILGFIETFDLVPSCSSSSWILILHGARFCYVSRPYIRLYPEEYGIPWHVQNNVAEHAAKRAFFGFGFALRVEIHRPGSARPMFLVSSRSVLSKTSEPPFHADCDPGTVVWHCEIIHACCRKHTFNMC